MEKHTSLADKLLSVAEQHANTVGQRKMLSTFQTLLGNTEFMEAHSVINRDLTLPLLGGGNLKIYKFLREQELVVSLDTHNVRGEMTNTPLLVFHELVNVVSSLDIQAVKEIKWESGSTTPVNKTQDEHIRMLINFDPKKDIDWNQAFSLENPVVGVLKDHWDSKPE